MTHRRQDRRDSMEHKRIRPSSSDRFSYCDPRKHKREPDNKIGELDAFTWVYLNMENVLGKKRAMSYVPSAFVTTCTTAVPAPTAKDVLLWMLMLTMEVMMMGMMQMLMNDAMHTSFSPGRFPYSSSEVIVN